MTVKELITILLDMDMNKEVCLEYPTSSGSMVGNYYRYEQSENFKVTECTYGVIIGVSDDN